MNFLKLNVPVDIDSVERTQFHKEVIKNKKFLRNLYIEWYSEFINESTSSEQVLVELGSGGGFLKELLPNVITSDILELPGIDKVFSALEMPFNNNSVDAFFMIDTFHHIPDAEKYLNEVQRCLKVNGKLIMIEPWNSLWGRFIYKNFHHEPFEPQSGWTIPAAGPLSGANGALPYVVFEKDKKIFESKFPYLNIQKIYYHTPFRYLLSGGVSMKQLVPDFMFKPIKFLELLLKPISKQTAMFCTIKISKK